MEIEKGIVDDVAQIEQKGKATNDVEQIAKSLVKLYETAERFPHIRANVEDSCKVVMKQHTFGATRDQFIKQQSITLKDNGRHGNELLMEMPEFAEIQIKLWKQKTNQQGIDFGVEKFVTTDDKTMWEKLSSDLVGTTIKQK